MASKRILAISVAMMFAAGAAQAAFTSGMTAAQILAEVKAQQQPGGICPSSVATNAVNAGLDSGVVMAAMINAGGAPDTAGADLIRAGGDATVVMQAALVAGADVNLVRTGARAAGVSDTVIAQATQTRVAGQTIPAGPGTFGTVGVGAAGGGGGPASGQ